MKNFNKKVRVILLVALLTSFTVFTSCNKDDGGGGSGLANGIELVGNSEVSVIEGETGTVTVSYELAAAARNSGTVVIMATTDGLTYGENYTTDPAESGGDITISFQEGATVLSFTVTIIDDDTNRENGSVTFSLEDITGEDVDIPSSGVSLTLNITDNEGESITFDAEDAKLGDVEPGSTSTSTEVTFSTLNVISDITATASSGFEVSATMDGSYGATATLASDATSFFVRAAPAGAALEGESTGSVTLTVGDAEENFSISAVVTNNAGVLYWAEYFDYPTDATYPAYLDNYPTNYAEGAANFGIVPISAKFRAAANYNGNDGVSSGNGLARTGIFDTWYGAVRLRSVAMGDGPLTFAGYPGSGTGRTARLAQDYSNQSQRGDCKNEGDFLSKNTFIARRFVDNGSEITEGTVYAAAMVKVNELFPETETNEVKNAVFMLTGDANFVNDNAMKLNIKSDGASGFNFGVSKTGDDGEVNYGSTSYALGTTYVVVLKVEVKADAIGADPNDAVSVYVFEPGATIPFVSESSLTAEAVMDDSNQPITAHDVSTGLEIFYTREVADVFNSSQRGATVDVHDVEFSGIRVGTSWSAIFCSEPLYDNVSDDDLQTIMHGHQNCSGQPGPPNNLGNFDQ